MSQAFGIDDVTVDVATIGAAGVDAGLDRLASPPPWLLAIEDADRLRADLEQSVPELSSGRLRLAACKFKRARIVDGTWSSLCRLTIQDPADGSTRTVDIRGTLVLPGEDPPVPSAPVPFDDDGWRCYLPDIRWEFVREESDTSMPAMPDLTDPERSRTFLSGVLGGAEITSSSPEVMRYREGRRCTIRYELEYAEAGAGPANVLAKVYEGDEGVGTYEAMRALWSSPLRSSTTVAIAEPLGIVPERHVMLQGFVRGERPMKDHIKTAFKPGVDAGVEALSALVRKAGRGLGELHTSGADVGPVVSWSDQVDAVRAANAELASVIPDLAAAMEPLVAGLESASVDTGEGPLVPTHRSFRPAQILVDGDDIAFIDFDGFCRAEAGLDLALFRTTLCDLALRAMETDDEPLPADEQAAIQVALDELCATFLAGYTEVAEYSAARLSQWDLLTSAKDILDCWRKVKFEHLERRMRFLHHKLGDE
jgi:hypothetical protein